MKTFLNNILETTKTFLKKVYFYFLTKKEIFWVWFSRKVLRISFGDKLNFWQLIIYFFVFPIKLIKFNPKYFNGFDVSKNIWTINGFKFHQSVFNSLANSEQWIKIEKREDGLLTVKNSGIKDDNIAILPIDKFLDSVLLVETKNGNEQITFSFLIKY